MIVVMKQGTGKCTLVNAMSKAAIAAGADGLMVEVHTHPEKSVSDADQTISAKRFTSLMREIAPITKAVGRNL